MNKVCFLVSALMVGSLPDSVRADDAPWQGRWIAYPYKMALNSSDYPKYPAPMFRKAFTVDADVKDAVLRVSGLGFFTCSLDGRRISDARLVPAI